MVICFEILPLKVLGPDGFPTLVYRHYWPIVEDQVVASIQSFFRDGWMPRDPNRSSPSSPRNKVLEIPINSGLEVYVTLAIRSYKYLVNRLRPLLGKLID